MPRYYRSILAAVVAALVFMPGSPAVALVIRGGHPWGFRVVEKLAKPFAEPRSIGPASFDAIRWDDAQNIEQLADGQCDILVHRGFPNEHEAALLEQRFAEADARPRTFVVAQGKAAVIVHPSNPIKSLTLEQVKKLLMMEKPITQWKELGGRSGAIKCYGEKRDGPSRLIIRHACMMLGPKHPTGHYLYREDFAECEDDDEVVEKVRKDQNAVGFILYHGQPLKGVKLLSIGAGDQGPFITPGPLIQKDYPLSEPLVLYLHPQAPELAKEFCEFAVSKEGAEIVARHGFITPYASAQAEAEERLAQMKAGKGERIQAIGGTEGTALMRELAGEYTRAKAVVQMGYAATADPATIAAFVAGKDLMLLRGSIMERQLSPASKAKWDAIARPAGASPGIVEYCLAGRSVAVVVHSLNKLDAVTPDQARAIFSGKVKDWKTRADANRPAQPDLRGSDIRCFGPEASDPVFELFHRGRKRGHH